MLSKKLPKIDLTIYLFCARIGSPVTSQLKGTIVNVLKNFLFATLAMIGLGSSAVAQTALPAVAAVNLKTDQIVYDNGTTIDVNRHGHLIVKSGKWTLLFDPKTHTLTNPIRLVNERIDPQVSPNGHGLAKTYQTEGVPGSNCPVALTWNVGYTVTEGTATVNVNGVPTTVKVEKSSQNATWACGSYGGDTATITTEYAPDLGVIVAFTMDMKYRGQSNLVSARLAGVTQAARTTQAGDGTVVATANKQ